VSQPDEKGYCIDRFRAIDGLDSRQAEAIKNATTPVVKIPLLQNQEIYYAPTKRDGITLTNRAPRTTDIVIFGNSIMYDKQDVEAKGRI